MKNFFLTMAICAALYALSANTMADIDGFSEWNVRGESIPETLQTQKPAASSLVPLAPKSNNLASAKSGPKDMTSTKTAKPAESIEKNILPVNDIRKALAAQTE